MKRVDKAALFVSPGTCVLGTPRGLAKVGSLLMKQGSSKRRHQPQSYHLRGVYLHLARFIDISADHLLP